MANLTRTERDEKERKLTAGLEHLIDGLCVSWSEDERFQPKEYIEHYEFVLALELLAAIVVKDAKPLSVGQLAEFDALGKAMSLSGNEYLDDLHDYAAKLGLESSPAAAAQIASNNSSGG